MSKENAPCIGPVSLRDAYEVCPLSMKLSLDTALLKPKLRTRQSDSLFYCLKLSPRCFHCETVRIAKKLGKSNFIRDLLTITTAKPFQVPSTARTVKPICRAKNCRRSAWQDVGVYCEMHYNVIPYICSWGNERKTGSIMSVRLIEKLNGPQVLSRMLNRIFKSESPELTDVLSAISNPDPDGPRVYAIDTEFYQPHTGGGRKISEVAFADVKTGQIVVDAVLNDEKGAVEASTKLVAYKLLQESSTSQHVRQIHTAVEITNYVSTS
jgi:hypothetical protein